MKCIKWKEIKHHAEPFNIFVLKYWGPVKPWLSDGGMYFWLVCSCQLFKFPLWNVYGHLFWAFAIYAMLVVKDDIIVDLIDFGINTQSFE